MWIVRIALSKPYTFIVLALMIFLLGVLAIVQTPKDIFPNINMPVVSVIWSFSGMPPEEMAGRITGGFERVVTTTVDNIEHIESQSLFGISITKLYFYPSVDVALALSQVSAISQTLLRTFPPGIQPPQILLYNASTVPVLQMVLSSPTLSEQKLNDLGMNFIRTQLAVVQGAALPSPYGGKVRQIQIDLQPQAMQANGISALDVTQALEEQNLILPAGTEKIGKYEYYISTNANPENIQEINQFPIKFVNGTLVKIGDVANVRDGFPPQTNIVNVDGTRAVLMLIQKVGTASTLAIVDEVKSLLPRIRDSLPTNLSLTLLSDESIFVRTAINDLIREGVLAAVLTGLMILVFVGSWQSTIIITISIPLSILSSIIIFSALGQTINLMTLGGLALAVGILVDDATVTIENINWHIEQGKAIKTAILDGAKQIALPALVSTLCICIVFLPMFSLKGVSHYLFTPLAEAVIFAMLASYFLSRTLVPTLASYWLKAALKSEGDKHSRFENMIEYFEQEFSVFKAKYLDYLRLALNEKEKFCMIFILATLGSIILLFPFLGENFFPSIDSGQIKLHVHTRSGTRVEETAKYAAEIDNYIKKIIPSSEIKSIVDNVGLPVSGINMTYSNSYTIGPADVDIIISLKEKHHPISAYIKTLRSDLPKRFPEFKFAFLPADMVGQILNFGLPSPIDIQISGLDFEGNKAYMRKLMGKLHSIPGIADLRIYQSFDYPMFKVNTNRGLAKEIDLTQSEVSKNMLVSLSGSFQVFPTFWLDKHSNISYPISIQTPQYQLTSLESLKNISISELNKPPSILGAVTQLEHKAVASVESHYNTQRVIDIFASVQDRDLASVSKDIDHVLEQTKLERPKGSLLMVRGQAKVREEAYHDLYAGLLFSIVLVYLLLVINFQSWLDPFIIINALPAALAGIVWMLFTTHTTLSIPALMGAIMTMGVATANSVLVVSFAKERLMAGDSPMQAAAEAAATRLRPVLMTALAMMIGMLPMAIGFGEGAEQNAPLGRSVIGGLLFATFSTLFFVPSLFAIFHEKIKGKANEN